VASLDNFPIDWAHPVAVVTMPDEIDIANAEDIRDTLLAVLNQGITTLIIDLSGTTFCACAGASAFARAQLRARAAGGQVRLATRTPIVRRLFAITGLDRLMPVYDSLAAARAAGQAASPGAGPGDPASRPA
jgi:anti-sigma B factor antagonist